MDQIDQMNATWGLDRIDVHGLDGNYTYSYDGSGVKVFVIDSGIRLTHEDFQGRAVCGYSFFEQQPDCEDDLGHGSHVAGTGEALADGSDCFCLSLVSSHVALPPLFFALLVCNFCCALSYTKQLEASYTASPKGPLSLPSR